MRDKPRVMVGGGGDGTISAVAAALVGTDTALGVLPLGTLNHFAKDLAIPLDLDGAARVIASGHRVAVDVGDVNGRVFVNNSSLGLYPDMVRDRERQRQRLGRGKWAALAWASITMLRRYPFLDAAMSIHGHSHGRRTAFVFIGNNEYVMEGFDIGSRPRLNGGTLSVYVTHRCGRAGLFLLALRALVGRMRQARDLDALTCHTVTIESRHRRLRVANDGEVVVMETPLRYRVRPGALTVLAAVPDRAAHTPAPESWRNRMRTLVHLSDLHFGRTDPALLQPLARQVDDVHPDVVVVSGDLTQRATRSQFVQARRFLDTLPHPQIVVPGNHDIPLYNAFRRFISPLRDYRRIITADLHPEFIDDEIAVIGVNTARSLTLKDGRINAQQMARVHSRFCSLDDRLTTIVVTHHPFDLPEGYERAKIVGRASLAMRTFATCGADILLSGHLHVSHTSNTAARYRVEGFAALVVQAGTAASTRERGEANTFNVVRCNGDDVGIERMTWDAQFGRFMNAEREAFHYTSQGWSPLG